jgi:hypothetical protein
LLDVTNCTNVVGHRSLTGARLLGQELQILHVGATLLDPLKEAQARALGLESFAGELRQVFQLLPCEHVVELPLFVPEVAIDGSLLRLGGGGARDPSADQILGHAGALLLGCHFQPLALGLAITGQKLRHLLGSGVVSLLDPTVAAFDLLHPPAVCFVRCLLLTLEVGVNRTRARTYGLTFQISG